MKLPLLKELKFSAEPHLVSSLGIHTAHLRPKANLSNSNPVSGPQKTASNPAFHAPRVDLDPESIILASKVTQKKSIAQRGRGLTPIRSTPVKSKTSLSQPKR